MAQMTQILRNLSHQACYWRELEIEFCQKILIVCLQNFIYNFSVWFSSFPCAQVECHTSGTKSRERMCTKLLNVVQHFSIKSFY